MRTHDGAVEVDLLKIGLFAQDFENVLPGVFVRPAREAHIDAIPRTKFVRQVAPWTACAGQPQNGLDKQAIVGATTTTVTCFALQQRLDSLPLIITQQHSQHPRLGQS